MKTIRLAILSLLALAVSCKTELKTYVLEVGAEYNHDRRAYTQGLFIDGGEMFESTGEYGRSSLRKVDLRSGEVLAKVSFPEDVFAEGSVIFDGQLYVLTWREGLVYKFDPDTLEEVAVIRGYPREGWGLTTDGEYLIASDGSSRLYFLDKDMRLVRELPVRRGSNSVPYLNELEYIDGLIWANVYTKDEVVMIDPASGKVVGSIDCSGLLPDNLRRRDTDVQNGIAYDKDNGKIYMTGKDWPRLYEVSLIEIKK